MGPASYRENIEGRHEDEEEEQEEEEEEEEEPEFDSGGDEIPYLCET